MEPLKFSLPFEDLFHVQCTTRMAEKFCLKWNDFHSNVSKSFSLFRNEDYLHDVTLVSDDHSKIQAHKLVLSACSDYFKDIFKNNHHAHPLLCLGGISTEDLMNIMDYIYNGEVQIYQENLDRFLKVAQRLKLEGLIGGKDEDETDNLDTVKDEFVESKDDVSYISNVNELTRPEIMVAKKKRETFAVTTNAEDKTAINEQIYQYLEECSDGSFKCTFCGKTSNGNSKKSTQKYNIISHIETHIEGGISYSCPLCNKTFRSKNALACHKYSSHK